MNSFNCLTTVNIELTSRCNKDCWMCGRRKRDKENPDIIKEYGDMDISLVKKIAEQLPSRIVVQLHNNGEPTLYPKLGKAIKLFKKQITGFNTNAILLLEKADEIIDNLDTLTISVIQEDKDGDAQYEIVEKFLKLKKDRKPLVVLRLLGDLNKLAIKKIDVIPCVDLDGNLYCKSRWYDLAKKYRCIIATRILHNPMGSFSYEKKVTVPEMGICLDLLNHMAIAKDGNVFPCVRFNHKEYCNLGNANLNKLSRIWNSNKRKRMIEYHKEGRRKLLKLCDKCEFFGVPTSP